MTISTDFNLLLSVFLFHTVASVTGWGGIKKSVNKVVLLFIIS